MSGAIDQQTERRPWVFWVGLVVFSCFFLKNAWIDEDAYITFRSLEQLFAGNGPVWNPHERVQAFTHPLWFLLLAGVHVAIADLYVAALVSAWALGLALVLVVFRGVGNDARFGLAGLLLVSSKSFFDFTSSGLEGPLTYLLLASAFFAYVRVTGTPEEDHDARARSLRQLALAVGLLLITRLDSLWLTAPMLAHAAHCTRALTARRILTGVGVGLIPPILWTLFSLFYYGFPLPNTAYAKLATGIPAATLAAQGFHYLQSLCVDDPLGALVLASALVLAAFALRRPGTETPVFVVLGIALHIIYVIRIGGDYMTGRFFGGAVLIAVLLIVTSGWLDAKAMRGGVLGLVVLSWLVPGSPVLSGPGYVSEKPNSHGIGDQRGLFFQTTSLGRWWQHDPAQPFPDYRWSREGLTISNSAESVFVRANIGFLGYYAGTDKIIVDRLGLSDPLLARLPSLAIWRIGHFPRRIPEGYVESIGAEHSMIMDPKLRAVHDRLRVVTEGPLFGAHRFAEIVRLNFLSLPVRSSGNESMR